MISKCACQFCGINIEFDVEAANSFVPCPACAKQTRLLIPATPKPTPGESFIQREIGLLKTTPALLRPAPETIESKLEAIGKFFFWGGIIACAILFFVLCESISSDRGIILPIILIIVGTLAQAIIIRVLFQAAAEVIRLLRKIAAKP